ncbi:outer membrane lipoprotein-sorting protein [Agarivorans litoreus]|uniref:outer membrane lipoprotein-sorting protein n=1 Tax=Agarivorans litoreus TaxID=1510455 RepID=UPI001C7D6800|nr:outer membrane lipoprotein-sorting protein [Agarivorans litoreus]
MQQHFNKKPLSMWLNRAAVICISLLFSQQALAETAEEKGLRIAQERKAFDLGWVDSKADTEMVLYNAQGDKSTRSIRIQSLEVEGDGDKALSVFDHPADVKGTAFLSFSHALEPDEQWLYLPALKRVKRIGSRNKSGPYMGSEFAFEDLSSFEVEKYTYTYLRDETIAGFDSYVIENVPVDKYSGYTKQITWMDKEAYRVHKVEFYDRKGQLLKTLTMSDYQVYADKHWRPSKMLMVNHQTDKKTEMFWNNYQFKTGVKESDFNKSKLKRAR